MAFGGMAGGGRATVAALAVTVAVALAACSGGPGPVVTETPTGGTTGSGTTVASPTPTADLTPTASPSASVSAGLSDAELLAMMPPGADRPDVQGAVVTAQFFLEQYAPMFHTGDTSVWDALSGPSCGYCSESSANAREVQSRGWEARGGAISPVGESVDAGVGSNSFVDVRMTAELEDAFLVKDTGTPELVEPASTSVFTLELELVGTLWRVRGVMVDTP